MTVNVHTFQRASSAIYGFAKSWERGCWLLPANSCPAIPLALLSAGVEFEFIDIDLQTLSLDVELATKRLAISSTKPVAGIIYVRGYGNEQFAGDDITALRKASGSNVCILDDRCLCTPQVDPETVYETQANAAIFSTGYGKVLDLRKGGYAFTKMGTSICYPRGEHDVGAFDLLMNRYALAIRNKVPMFPAFDRHVESAIRHWLPTEAGPKWADLKSEIDERLPALFSHKTKLNEVYASIICDQAAFAPDFQNWRHNLFVPDKSKLLKKIFDEGLYASGHYASVADVFGQVSCPNTCAIYERTINLFNDFHFTLDQASKLVGVINEHRAASKIGN
jgi:hypothetical protein